MEFIHVLMIVGALLVGLAGGALLARLRATAQTGELSAKATAAERELATVRQMHTEQLQAERDAAAERLHSERTDAAQRLEEERAAAAERLSQREGELSERLRVREEELLHLLESEREAAKARVEEVRADHKRLADEFEALSRKALEANSRTFLEQANERFKRAEDAGASELAKREEAIKALVEPLQRTLGEVKKEMSSAEKARLEAHTALHEQVQAMRDSSDSLRTETTQLVTALRAPQVRGRWGELQLRRVVEAAGMVEHVDFTEQERLDDGALRPDLVVKLPGDKQIVVDSKVSFNGYLEAMEARDEETRANRLKAHARHLRQHIDDLDSKAYWEHITGAPEFTVMFVPAEAFLNAALEQDPTLLEHAFTKNVVVATPPTLVALLRTVGYTWRQELLAAEAQQVFTVGRELHKRLATFGDHLQKVSRRLNSTVEAFNAMNASLDSRLVTQARKFSSLQGLEPSLEVPPPLEVLAVAAHKEDLYPAEDDGDQQAQIEHRDETARLVESAEHVAKKVNTAGDDDAQADGDATGAALA
ncbi:MAG TPA: DNA recombination protein RmuC [Beutenbergiaceae bacterium]|nr:DNA recombination protein RmuC [Beutenbergiaceae bacterium]